jgi:integrase
MSLPLLVMLRDYWRQVRPPRRVALGMRRNTHIAEDREQGADHLRSSCSRLKGSLRMLCGMRFAAAPAPGRHSIHRVIQRLLSHASIRTTARYASGQPAIRRN